MPISSTVGTIKYIAVTVPKRVPTAADIIGTVERTKA